MDDFIREIRRRTEENVFDYGFLMDCLKAYQAPRVKVTQLLRKGVIIRLRKGLYVLGPDYRLGALSLELVANLLYGPSYVSLEYALQHYGLIPEFVAEITSVSLKRNKRYDTPIGRFTFKHSHPATYFVGVRIYKAEAGQPALIATPEKALCDYLVLKRGQVKSLKSMEQILFEDLRIEEEDLLRLDNSILQRLQHQRPHSAVEQLSKLLRAMQNES